MQTIEVYEDVITDYRWGELKEAVERQASVRIGKTTFFSWLPFALIEPSEPYTERDRLKLTQFARFMKRYKSKELARQRLIEHMSSHPERYPNE